MGGNHVRTSEHARQDEQRQVLGRIHQLRGMIHKLDKGGADHFLFGHNKAS